MSAGGDQGGDGASADGTNSADGTTSADGTASAERVDDAASIGDSTPTIGGGGRTRADASGETVTGAGPVPPTIAGYDRFQLLGRGGFATVWTARQVSVERDVAVKVLDQALHDDDAVRRFRAESSTLAELSWHPNVVHIYDTGTTADGRPYIAMEHLTGGTLGAAVRRDGPMPTAEVVRIGAALSDAVATAHEADVLHRDIKPDNVLLDRRGEPRLADFGIARIASDSTTITGGAFRGTVLHAAPELFDGEQPSVATDVWSLGSTLYTLAAGHPPFARADPGDDSVSAIIRRTLLDEPPTLPDDVDEQLGRTILSCLAKEPDRRPESAVELRRQLLGESAPADPGPALGETLDPASAGARAAAGEPAAAADRRRRVGLIGVAAVAALLAVVALAGWNWTSDDDPEGGVAESEATENEPTGTTTTTTTPSGVSRDAGVTNRRPAGDSGRADTSAALRSRLESFAASTDATAVREPSLVQEVGGPELEFGELPARVDLAAGNEVANPACTDMLLDDVVIVGAAGSVWFGGTEAVILNAVQTDSPESAERYFWLNSLFFGLGDGQCQGWPESGVADNPDEVVVERRDFELDATPDALITAIGSEENFGSVEDLSVIYQSLSLVGDTVVVANVANVSRGTDPASFVAVIDEAIAAFLPPTG